MAYIVFLWAEMYLYYLCSTYSCEVDGLMWVIPRFGLDDTKFAIRLQLITCNTFQFVTDINECHKNRGGCKDRCHNLKGSYRCDCENEDICQHGYGHIPDTDKCLGECNHIGVGY